MRNPLLLDRARDLRKRSTDAERRLWNSLRQRQVSGQRFRRQVPLNGHIVDFLCAEARLVIELDGGQHALDADYDSRRTANLRASGFRVLRFWNNQIFEEPTAVLEAIERALRAGQQSG